MSANLYTKAKEGILNGSISWLTDNVKVVLVDSGTYTVNLTTHQYLSDIAGAARIATSGVLANRSATGGMADADDLTISTISGASVEAIVLYTDTGTDTTSRLIAYIDAASAGLPFTPNGGDILIQWSASNGIFKL